MTVGSARPLEDAFRIAHTEMVRWIEELTGLSAMDAYQLVSQTALTPVANVVDTNYSVVCKVAKQHLPGHPGRHERRALPLRLTPLRYRERAGRRSPATPRPAPGARPAAGTSACAGS